MNSHRARSLFATLFTIVCIASIVALAAFADRLSAGFQLFLYAIVLFSFVLAVATSCYQALEPGEVLIVFGRDGKPKVRRGGTLVFPVITQVSRLRLSPKWIEFPREGTSDGKIPLNRENRLITKDGLPVTTLARVQIVAAGDDDSLIKVIESFGQKGDLEIKEHFTKLLGGAVSKVIAETNAEDLHNKHQEFEDSVQNGLQFETFGYRSTSPVKIGPVTQLSIEEAGLEGGDKTRAERVLDILRSKEEIRKIEQTREKDKANAESDKQQTQRDIDKKEDDKRKKEVEHAYDKQQAQNKAEIDRLKIQEEEDLAKRRIQKEEAVKRAELERDKALADLQVDKLAQDVRIKQSEHATRVADLEAGKKEGMLRAQTDSEVGAIRLKLGEEHEQSAIRLRGEELRQNIENHEGDLEYQLKKLVLKAATDLSRDSATAIAAALTKANVTLIGDPAAAAQLATEQTKALRLGVVGKEILALLGDVRLHDAVAGITQGLRSGPHTSPRPSPSPAARDATASRVDSPADNTFEP